MMLLSSGEVVQFSAERPGIASKKIDLRAAWHFAQNVRSINSISHTEVVMSLTDVETIKKAVQAFSHARHGSTLAGDRCQTAS